MDGEHRDQAGEDDDRRQEDLWIRADQRRAARGRHVARGEGSLDLGEVRRPVSEAEHEPETEHNADPVRGERVGDVVDPEALPRMQAGLTKRLERLDLGLEAINAADRVERDDRQWEKCGDDHEELEHLVVDRGGETTERDVDEYEHGGHEDREGHRPTEHEVDDQCEREQVDAGDEHRGHGERPGVEGMRRLVEAQP